MPDPPLRDRRPAAKPAAAGRDPRRRGDTATPPSRHRRRHSSKPANAGALVDAGGADATARQARPLRRRRRDLRADRHRCARPAVRTRPPARAPGAATPASARPRAGPRAVGGAAHSPAPAALPKPTAPPITTTAARTPRRPLVDRPRPPPPPRRRAPAQHRRPLLRRRRPAASRATAARRAPAAAAAIGDDAARTPGALHRDPAEGLAREDHRRRNQLLQARVQMTGLLARAAAVACDHCPALALGLRLR